MDIENPKLASYINRPFSLGEATLHWARLKRWGLYYREYHPPLPYHLSVRAYVLQDALESKSNLIDIPSLSSCSREML